MAVKYLFLLPIEHNNNIIILALLQPEIISSKSNKIPFMATIYFPSIY